MAIHWIVVSSHSLVIESNSPWKDEDRSRPHVMHGILAVEFGLLRYETQPNRITWWICVCSSHQWLTRIWYTQRLELAFQIVDLWIVDEFVVIPTHISHVHLSDFDVSILHSFGQSFVNRRSHRTYTSCFWRDFYSSNHFDYRCIVWIRSSPWCTWIVWERGLYLSCGSRCKEIEHLWTCDVDRFENSRNGRIFLWNYRRIQITEWLQIHWVRLSTILPILRISLHFVRMPCYHKCPLLPRFHESTLRTPCTCLVVSTTCCIHFHHPSYDLQWSCLYLHLPEWDIVVDTCYNRYSGDNWLSKDGRNWMFVSNECAKWEHLDVEFDPSIVNITTSFSFLFLHGISVPLSITHLSKYRCDLC